MNNFTKMLCGAASVMLLATGCKKLDETPYDFYAPENVYKTADDAEAAIAGVYARFNANDYYFTKPYWEWLAEDEDHIAGESFALGDTGAGNYDGDYKTPIMYTSPYIIIARANTVLENVPAISMDQTRKDRILGEARFMRAWCYFTLVRLYGPVPLRTASVASIADTNVPRTPVADVYKQIIEDLTQAETLMPYQDGAGAGALGHANKGAAQALLAKVYATIGSASLRGAQVSVKSGGAGTSYTYTKNVVAGYEGFDSRAYYQLAKDEAAKLITSGKYQLFPNYMDLWKKENDNIGEHIFMTQTLAGDLNHMNFVGNYFTSGDLGGRGYLRMSTDFYKTFSPVDDRVQKGVTHKWFEDYGQGPFYHYYPREDSLKYYLVSIIPLSAAHPVRLRGDTTFATYSNKAQILKYYVPGKPIAPNNSDSNPGATNYPLLRYADVLLTYAEAENELNGNTAAARQYYAQVRRRSNPGVTTTADPLLNPVSLSQTQLRSAILAERAQELHFESNRRYDLQRWGIYLQVMNQIGVSNQNIIKTRSAKHLLLPLPAAEISSSTLVMQNPGW